MNEKPKLSRRQKTILDFIRQTILARGWAPSIREIGEAVGLSSSSTVFSHLKALEAKGYLRRNPSTPRSIILLDPKPTPTAAEERVTELEALLEQFEFCYAGECAWCNEHEELWRDDMGWQHIPGCPWGQAADNHRARVEQPAPAGELAEREAA